MQKVISTEKLPIKLWLDEPEEGAVKQAMNLANLPFAFNGSGLQWGSYTGNQIKCGACSANGRCSSCRGSGQSYRRIR